MHAYVAGPMTGIKFWNFPAFEEAEDWLLSEGWDVTSPHRIDLENGFNPFNGDESPALEECARRDIDAIFSVDAIVLLPGWRESRGAVAERALANWLSKPCFEYPEMTPLDPD